MNTQQGADAVTGGEGPHRRWREWKPALDALDAYNARVALTHKSPTTSDTAPDIDARLTEAWRRMSSVEIAAHLTAAWRAGQQLTWFSLKEQFPDASDDELTIRVAAERLGWELAVRIHPEAARLAPRR